MLCFELFRVNRVPYSASEPLFFLLFLHAKSILLTSLSTVGPPPKRVYFGGGVVHRRWCTPGRAPGRKPKEWPSLPFCFFFTTEGHGLGSLSQWGKSGESILFLAPLTKREQATVVHVIRVPCIFPFASPFICRSQHTKSSLLAGRRSTPQENLKEQYMYTTILVCTYRTVLRTRYAR